jgi:hypothetical protein
VVLGNIHQFYHSNKSGQSNLAGLMNEPEFAIFNDEAHNSPAPEYEATLLRMLRRDMQKLNPAVERMFLEARLTQDGPARAPRAGGPFDEAWSNGDCAVPGVQSLDGLFKRLLEEEEKLDRSGAVQFLDCASPLALWLRRALPNGQANRLSNPNGWLSVGGNDTGANRGLFSSWG